MVMTEGIRVGGRSARIQIAVHQAVRELSREIDRGDLTIPRIAERAGVTPSTIYRRWRELTDLLADVAVERLRPASDPTDTGSVRSDLKKWAEQYLEEMSSEVGRMMLHDVLANAHDDKTVGQCDEYTRGQLSIISGRARKRGECSFDVDDAIDLLIAPLMYRILFSRREITLPYCMNLVDRLLPEN